MFLSCPITHYVGSVMVFHGPKRCIRVKYQNILMFVMPLLVHHNMTKKSISQSRSRIFFSLEINDHNWTDIFNLGL